MTRPGLIVAIGALSFGVAACGDYDQKADEENNAAYDEKDNVAYDAGNEGYDTSDDNAAYAPPPDGNLSPNLVDEVPPDNTITHRY
jgi:hypothetical protein